MSLPNFSTQAGIFPATDRFAISHPNLRVIPRQTIGR
jgi:hypothetical protein